MRIHNKTIRNIETNAVLYDDAFDYIGPVAQCGKAPKMKASVPPPPTQEEIEQRQLSNLASRASLHEQGFETFTDSTGKLQLRKRALTADETSQAELESELLKRARADLKLRAGEVSPEQQKALDELYDVEQSKMDEELSRFAVEQSGARGLSLGDTPLAREVLLAKIRGQKELGASRAGSKLEFANKERLFTQGMNQWRGDLQQQRLANLIASGATAGQTAIGFMGARANLRPQFFSGGGGGSNVGSILSGVGSGIQGLAMFKSSKTAKHNIEDIPSDKQQKLTTQLLNVPVCSWSYKGETAKHIGPMTEDLPAAVVTPDGKAINVIDMIGALLLTVQTLGKKIEAVNG